MKHLGILKPDTLVNLLNYVGLPFSVLYFASMFIIPWVKGDGDWVYVQDVWDRWQSLNVGMLAFVSSITAFNIARYNANKQRERNFLAEKAFLPSALSELCTYFKKSASIFIKAWEASATNKPNLETPDLPKSYKDVFRQCIRYADPDVGKYLSTILIRLQVHDARLRGVVEQFDDPSFINPDKLNIITYLYRLAELQAYVNKLFPFARGIESFDSSPLTWEDYKNALGNLDVWIDHIHIDENMNLESFIKRAIERGNDIFA